MSESQRGMMMDSRVATYEHIQAVQVIMARVIADLQRRQLVHDRSKLESPEREIFDEYTPKLAATTYGSDEYRGYLAAMKPGLDHHYAANDHHPEYSALSGNGVDISQADLASGAAIGRMSLPEITEMLCDWKAATLRHANGDIRRSIEINQERFGYSDELKQILLNTLRVIEA